MPILSVRSDPTAGKGDNALVAPVLSAEALRRKVKYRLIGSVILVIVGVLGFTIMLDTQPRPVVADVAVVIPSRDKVPPLQVATPVKSVAASVAPPAAVPPVIDSVAPAGSLSPKEEIIQSGKSKVEPAIKPQATAPAATVASSKSKEATLPKVAEPLKSASSTKVAAAVDLNSEGVTTEKGRFILQVGAFAEVTKAREARMKLERAGIKTYTQVVETADGKRIRVRVGPFEKRADAEKVATKVKSLDLPVALLTL